MKNLKLINSIEKNIVIATIIAYPLFVSTLFVNLFETPKLIILFTSIILVLTIKAIKYIYTREEISFNTTPIDVLLLIFTIVYLASGFTNEINKIDIFLYPANGSFVLLSFVFYLILNQFKKEDKEVFLNSLLISGFVTSIIQIISFFGIIKLIPFLPDIIKTEVFTPTGNILSSIVLLLVLLPPLINKIFQKIETPEKVLSVLIIFIFLANIISSIYLILPNKETSIKILNYKTGWSLAVDALKINPILGTGPSNFAFIFNRYRPVEYNNTKDWQIKYIQSSSLALTILTESGILGILAFLFLMYKVLRSFDLNTPNSMSVVVFIISIFTLPLSYISLPIFIIIIAQQPNVRSIKIPVLTKKENVLFSGILSVIILVITSVYAYRLFFAEYIFGQSIKKVGQNQAIEAYNLVNQAVKLSPYTDRYHLFSSVVNLALAEALASKSDISDEDKSNVSKLVQQSIREGKAAVAVAKYKSTNWESLSNMYQKLVTFADGADTFAIESLNQAISLDPINPMLRVKLGSLYYSQKKYDMAIDTFKLAVIAKPDLANAHYNLAIAYKETKQLDKAKEEINTTLKLLGKETADYEKAVIELQNIEELTKPELAPEPIIDPQIELQ